MSVKESELVLEATGWDKLYVPTAVPESKYAITGNESQIVTVALNVGESVQAEPGTMMHMTSGMSPSIDCMGCWGRTCSGEACWVVNYANSGGETNSKGFVALTPSFPTAKVVPIDLSSDNVNGTLICQVGSFMASYGEVDVETSFDFNCLTCCCAGTGLRRQRLVGSGTAFLAATGTIVQKVLGDGEVILVDTNCILAFAGSCKLDVRRTGGILGMVGGGEGIFNTILTGPGLVIVQSMNASTFKEALRADKMWRR